MNKEVALDLLKEYVKSESLIKHCLAVASAMDFYAQKFSGDRERWYITGILHDFDYEKFPKEHPQKGSEILKEKGVDDEIIQAILGHADYTGVARKSQMAKCLYAVDELCGFIVACALVRPDKLVGMEAKSVKKKLKKKEFAANVSREEINKAVEEFGIDRDEHIKNIIIALQSASGELGF